MGDTPGPQPPPPTDFELKVDVAKIEWERAFKIFFTVLQEDNSLPGWLSATLQKILPVVIATLLGTVIRLQSGLGKSIGDAVDEVEKVAGPTLLAAAAAGLSDFFGIKIKAEELTLRADTDQRREVSDKIGRQVLKQMFREFPGGGELTPEDGRKRAEALIGFNLSTAIEGWLSGILTNSVLTALFPNWADLDTIVSQNLGLGRITRRVMAPILNAAAVEPFRWEVNKIYRPSIFSESEAVRALNAGDISEEEYFETMARQGWTKERAATLRLTRSRVLEKEDIAKALESQDLDEAQAEKLFRVQGFPPDTASTLLSITINDRRRTLNNAIESLARDMFRDREVDEAELRRLLKVAGRSLLEEDILVGIAFIERSRPRRMSRGTMELAFREGFIDLDALQTYYLEQGFAIEDVLLLEQLAIKKKLTAEQKEQAKAEAQKKTAIKAKT